jgi:predicted nucleic acid-binding protein
VKNAFALDTNIAIYAYSNDPRNERALKLLEAGPRLSVQLLNEFCNVGRRKRRLTWAELEEELGQIENLAEAIMPVDVWDNIKARRIAQRYSLSFYDSLMLAVALASQVETFYSEDMQHGLVIDDRLTILNPFLSEQVPA